MPYDFSDPNFDFAGQEDIVIRALKEAAAQRATPLNKGVNTGQHFAMSGADPGAFLSRAAGMINQRNAEGNMGALNKAQALKYAEMLRELNTPGTREVMDNSSAQGPLPEPVARTAPLAPLDESRRRMDVYGRMSMLPMAAKMAERGIASEVDMPEKMALREQQVAAAQEAARQRSEDQFRADRARAEDRASEGEANRALKMTLAQMAAANRGGSKESELDIALKEERLKAMREGKPVKPPTAAQLKQESINEAPDRIGNIIETAKKNEGAFGVVPAAASMLPNFIGSRITSKALTPEQRQARADVMRQAAQEIHTLYGAALSRGEANRANSFAPNPNDDYDSVMDKLKSAQNYAKSISKSSGVVKPTESGSPARRKYNPATGDFD